MNVNGLRAGARGPGAQGVKPASPVETGALLSSPEFKNPPPKGWLHGTVTEAGKDGTFRISTPAGDVSILAKNAELEVGRPVVLSIDSISGRVQFASFALPPASDASGVDEAMPVTPLAASAALQAALATSQIAPLMATGHASSHLPQQALSAIFPYAHSTSFALAASLFPMTVRGGIISELVELQEKRYGNLSRLTHVATTVNLEQVRPIDGSHGYISWNMPFFSEGKVFSTTWQHGTVPSLEDDKKLLRRTFLEAHFPFSGTIQVEMLLDDKNAAVAIASEIEIDAQVVSEIREIIHLIAKSMGLISSVSYAWGKDSLAAKGTD